jgi:hypothetical protein
VPPLARPCSHETKIRYAFVVVGLLTKRRGESGFVKMMAPLPRGESAELPITLVAVTLT